MKLNFTKVIFFLCILVFLSSSFDVFLNLRVGGFSIRFAVMIMILQILLFIFYLILTKFRNPIRFLGFLPFIIWFVLLTAFLPNTGILSRSIGYLLWLGIFTGFIILLPFFIKSEEMFIKMVKIYLLSFTLVAVFGLLQFTVGMAGIDLLTAQWWLNGRLPRINGFSYEPSYFSTYELIAWVTLFFLIINRNKLASDFSAKISLIIITASLLLSTSRMGLIFIFTIIVVYTFNQVKNTFVTFKIKKKTMPVFLSFLSFIGMFVFSFFYYFEDIKFMFNGLGIYGYAGHSSTQRMSEFTDTLEAFWNSPFIGYSLGGIPSAIAKVRGAIINTQLDTKHFEGMNVFAETLAASGIIGFIFFMSFLYILFSKSLRLIIALKPIRPEFSNLLFALLLGLLFELLILNMNQNILRTYLWVHIGIVNLGYFVGKGILQKSLTDPQLK